MLHHLRPKPAAKAEFPPPERIAWQGPEFTVDRTLPPRRGVDHNHRMPTLAGSVLIAAPELLDPNFARSVVLLIKHDSEGALGLVLNRPAPVPFHQVWSKISPDPCPVEAPLFIGGPCGGPLMALHDQSDLSETEAPDGVFFTAEIGNIRALFDRQGATLRIFGGYSGWGEGQLESELAAGGWLVRPIDKATLFSDPVELWETLIRQTRSETKLSDWLRIRDVPPEPWMN